MAMITYRAVVFFHVLQLMSALVSCHQTLLKRRRASVRQDKVDMSDGEAEAALEEDIRKLEYAKFGY